MTYTTGISDLINREVLKKRVRTTRDLMKRGGAHPEILERITLFATFRCNMACPYCQTIRHNTPDPETEFSIDQFCHTLDTFTQTPIRHIHFTGGEATLNPDLEAMIKESTRRGILCSLTTNGLAPFSLYERLIEEGLCEIRISCDSVASDSDRPNPFSRDQQNTVMRRIRELVQFKKSRKQPFTIIVNSCVSHDNRIELADQVITMTALNPDDVKLIPISYESPSLGFFPERKDIIKKIKEHLASLQQDHFSLLRSKLITVFASDTWGFRDWTSSRLMQHCYLPLTERTITGKGYYPCPVYVREGGAPLGKFGEPFRLQHQRIYEFLKGDSCREDPICLNNCVNCIKRFNLLANAVIGQSVIGKTGKREPVTHLIETGEKERVTDREVWDRIEQIGKNKAFGIHSPGKQHSLFYDDRIMGTSPFIIVKPGGMHYQYQILNFLEKEGIRIVQTHPIPNWNQMATGLYGSTVQYDRIAYGILLEKVLPIVEGRSDGLLLILDPTHDLDWLKQIKHRLRRLLPPSNIVIHHDSGVLMTSQGFIHTPDKAKWKDEMRYLKAELSLSCTQFNEIK